MEVHRRLKRIQQRIVVRVRGAVTLPHCLSMYIENMCDEFIPQEEESVFVLVASPTQSQKNMLYCIAYYDKKKKAIY